MIRKLKSGEYRLYSRKADPKTGKRRNLGTFGSRAAAQKHERDVQYFKRHGERCAGERRRASGASAPRPLRAAGLADAIQALPQ